MLLRDYIVEAAKTAVYPKTTARSVEAAYLVLGLIGEAYELSDQDFMLANKESVIKELGDITWYTAMLILSFGLDISLVLGLVNERLKQLPPADPPNNRLYVAWLQRAANSLADPAKKTLRNSDYSISQSLVLDVVVEVIALANHLANYFMYTLEQVMDMNIEKLKHRQEQGTLAGDGHGRDEGPVA